MGVCLVTGPARSGKTGAAVEEFCKRNPLDWAGRCRYIVPTTQMARQVESRLMERTGTSGILGNAVCTFFSFAGEFVASEGLSSRLISDIQKELMLQNLVRTSELDYFSRSAAYPGFIEALDGIIGELKVSLVTPEEFQQALSSSKDQLEPASVKKINELAQIYSRYQKDILEASNLHDREGLMWRALEIARGSNSLSHLELVVFDGFSEFGGVQREFLRIIASRVPQVMVTLPYEPGRGEVFDAVESDRRFLLDDLGADETQLTRTPQAPSALVTLEAEVFRSDHSTQPPDNTVTLVEGGNPTLEVELIADEIRRLTRDNGFAYGDIVITGRDLDGYRGRIERVFAEYDIPVEKSRRPLSETAFARLLVSCANIIQNGWHRDDVVRVIKSEILTDDLASACRAEVDAKQLGIIDGRENWLRDWGRDDRTHGFRNEILSYPAKFEDALCGANTVDEQVHAVRELLASFRWRTADDAALAQDAAASDVITNILQELTDAVRLIGGEPNPAEFLTLLVSSVNRSDYCVPAPVHDAVGLVQANTIGGRKFRAVFVVGMLEKVFPRQIREESFLCDRERAILSEHLASKLESRLGRQGSERFLFYCVIGAAKDRLYLCYPLADQAAKDSLPSFYLDEVRKLFTDSLPRIRRDVSEPVPAVTQAQSQAGLERAVIYSLSQVSQDLSVDAALAYNAFPGATFKEFGEVFRDCVDRSACISGEKLRERFAQLDKTYRCTELEAYAACPFMHFCQSALGLEPVREEVGALDLGSILHEVLYRLFTGLRERMGDGLDVQSLDCASVTKEAMGILQEEYDKNTRLAHLPAHEADTTLHTLQASLKRYIRGDIGSGWQGFVPTYFELEFGRPAVADRARDPLSTQEPLVIEGTDGSRVTVCGKMDRVDVGPGGALVIDYKLGTSTKVLGLDKGLTFQAMVYALALRKLFGLEPVGTEYRPIKKWAPDGYYATSSGITKRNRTISDEEFKEKMHTCEQLVADIAQDIRSGIIAVEPRDCKEYCQFKGVCRIDNYKLLMLKEAQRAAVETAAEEVEQ